MKRKRERESSDLSDSEHSAKKLKKSKSKKDNKKKEKKDKKKKVKKEKKKNYDKERTSKIENELDGVGGNGEVKKLAPMTKEEWEKQQNQVRR